MLLESHVLALLQASITGAGLVLAVYALIIPLWKKISRHRVNSEYTMYQRFRKRVAESKRPSADETARLKTMLESIEMFQNLPIYFSLSIVATFIGYMTSALLGLWWVLEWNREIMDHWLPLVFGLSTLLFLGIGLASIVQIMQATNREYEDFKREVEEAEFARKPSVEM